MQGFDSMGVSCDGIAYTVSIGEKKTLETLKTKWITVTDIWTNFKENDIYGHMSIWKNLLS